VVITQFQRGPYDRRAGLRHFLLLMQGLETTMRSWHKYLHRLARCRRVRRVVEKGGVGHHRPGQVGERHAALGGSRRGRRHAAEGRAVRWARARGRDNDRGKNTGRAAHVPVRGVHEPGGTLPIAMAVVYECVDVF